VVGPSISAIIARTAGWRRWSGRRAAISRCSIRRRRSTASAHARRRPAHSRTRAPRRSERSMSWLAISRRGTRRKAAPPPGGGRSINRCPTRSRLLEASGLEKCRELGGVGLALHRVEQAEHLEPFLGPAAGDLDHPVLGLGGL